MHRLSLVQALSLWSELEAAYYGKNDFGGDTAEVYLYRLMPRCPSAEAAERQGPYTGNSILTKALQDAVRDSNEVLLSILGHFAKTRDARIEVNGRELGDWLKTANFEHRVHVKVIRR